MGPYSKVLVISGCEAEGVWVEVGCGEGDKAGVSQKRPKTHLYVGVQFRGKVGSRPTNVAEVHSSFSGCWKLMSLTVGFCRFHLGIIYRH